MPKKYSKNDALQELTVKDKRILRELFLNARVPLSVIAKKVRLSKEVVNYRVKRMIDLGILVGFNTVLDVQKIGWQMFFCYIRYRSISTQQEAELLGYLSRHAHVAQVIQSLGTYDALIKLFAKDLIQATEIIKDIEQRYADAIENTIIDMIVDETAVPFSFMYGELPSESMRFIASKTVAFEHHVLDHHDKQLLRIIAKNARITIADISQQTKIPRDTVKYHLTKLEKQGIIIKYRPDVLPQKLGYNWYFIMLKLGKLNGAQHKHLMSFLTTHSNVTYVYQTIGISDLHIEIRAKTTEELHAILMEIRGILKEGLKHHESLIVLNELKYTYFPGCLMKGA